MAKRKPDNERRRFTIPEADEAARAWAANQSNLSLSLRILIRRCILQYGNEDIAVRELGMPIKRGPGRPRKDAATLLSGPAVPVAPRKPSMLSGEPEPAPAAAPPVSAPEPVPKPEPTQGPIPEAPASPQQPAATEAPKRVIDEYFAGSRPQVPSPLLAGIINMGSDSEA